MVSSNFVTNTDSSIHAWANEANQKLHGILVDAMGEEYVSSSQAFTTVANQSDYALPATFYKLYGVDLLYAGLQRSLHRYNRAERNLYRELNPEVVPRYALVGSNLRLYPIPAAGLSGVILFAPEATILNVGTDTVTYPNGWERFIVIDTAIQMLLKEESSVTGLAAERASIIREIESTKESRDLATPHQVVDTSLIDTNQEDWW